jgi:hypothetical protein
MPTHFELTDAVINATTTTNETNMLDRWVPDEDWVRSFRNQPGFKYVTPGYLNKAFSKTIEFINNKYVDPMSGRIIFHEKKQIVCSYRAGTGGVYSTEG